MPEERVSYFWDMIDELVASSEVVIDRPRGSAHPRYPEMLYPLDYGYLAGTSSADGDGIDIWRGSQDTRHVTGVVCTVDLVKRDSEIKILLGCSEAEMALITDFLNDRYMGCWLITRKVLRDM